MDVVAPVPSPSGPRSPCGVSSASVSGVCPSEQGSPPSRVASYFPDGFPCLAGSDLGVALGVSDVVGAGLHVGAQIGVFTGNRSSPVKVDEPIAIKAVNGLHFGPPDSMDLEFPAGYPYASSGSLEVQQSSKVGLILSEKSVDCGSLGSQLGCPVPSPFSDANEVAGSDFQNPVSGPLPATPSSVSWASIVGQQQNQDDNT